MRDRHEITHVKEEKKNVLNEKEKEYPICCDNRRIANFTETIVSSTSNVTHLYADRK